jgi:hypothetical protein
VPIDRCELSVLAMFMLDFANLINKQSRYVLLSDGFGPLLRCFGPICVIEGPCRSGKTIVLLIFILIFIALRVRAAIRFHPEVAAR